MLSSLTVFSANGTFVNGEKVGKGNKLLLQTGLEITLLQAKSTAKPRIRMKRGPFATPLTHA